MQSTLSTNNFTLTSAFLPVSDFRKTVAFLTEKIPSNPSRIGGGFSDSIPSNVHIVLWCFVITFYIKTYPKKTCRRELFNFPF